MNRRHTRDPHRRIATMARSTTALFGMALLAGCTTSSNMLSPQTKFAYANGDYTPIGHASAERKYTRFFSAPEMGREEFLELERQALASKPGADLLVDYLVSSDVTQVPFSILPIVTFTTFRVEGTAMRFTQLGNQQFRAAPASPPARAR